jgi:hypothetical protein
MMAHKNRISQRLLEAFKSSPRTSTEVTIRFPSGEPPQTVDWKEASDDRSLKSLAFARLSTLPIDGPLAAAFKTAELDPTDPAHWYRLMTFFAWAHYGDRRRKGAPQKWGALEYCRVIKDFIEVKCRNPDMSDESVFTILARNSEYKTKNGSSSTSRLRKLLKEALDPERNEVVHALKLELGDDLKMLQKKVGTRDGD